MRFQQGDLEAAISSAFVLGPEVCRDDLRIVSIKRHLVRLEFQERPLLSVTSNDDQAHNVLRKVFGATHSRGQMLCAPEEVLTDSCGDAIKLCGASHMIGRHKTTLEQQMHVQ